MAVAYSAVTQSGLLYQQYPPPILPKPGKENVKLKKLLKRSAKKKVSAPASQCVTYFRSSLSPVNEASPDLEHSDHSTPPKTPDTTFSFSSVKQPQRFTVRPLYRHVASPYPQPVGYGREVRLSTQSIVMPMPHVTTISSYTETIHLSGLSPALGPVNELVVPKISLTTSSATEATVPAAEAKKPSFRILSESHVGLGPTAAEMTLPPTLTRSGATLATRREAFIRPLTVLTPLFKSKSPRPTFKATERSRSPRPMFDVPQIRMYTASTSYYERSQTPPVYDSAGLKAIGGLTAIDGLSAIGSTVTQSKTPIVTKQDLSRHPLLGTDIHRKTTSESKRGTTPTSDLITILTPTAEIKRTTPTAEIKTAPPKAEIKRTTPTAEIKTAPPKAEIKRSTPTAEIRVKTPTYELQTFKTSTGRTKTSVLHVTRAKTPVFEISRPNPLLFAVSPVTVEPERSRTPKTVFDTSTAEPKSIEATHNGHIHSDMSYEVDSKSEPGLPPLGSQRLSKTPTSEPTTPEVSSYGYERPKTPTYEASRLMNVSPGFKRPKTPTYGASSSGASPVGFQKPKTPTTLVKKSNYRGLTSAEYTAYGGIKTYSSAFDISSSKIQIEEEVIVPKEESEKGKTHSLETSMKELSTAKMSKVIETPSIPTIIVSQESDTSEKTLTLETSFVSGQGATKQDITLIQEATKSKPPTEVEKTPDKQPTGTPTQKEVAKPIAKTDGKRSLSKGEDQDPLKAVRRLLGKDKAPVTKQKSGTYTKAVVSGEKEITVTEDKYSKPSSAAPAQPPKASTAKPTASEDKEKQQEPESVQSGSEKKEVEESLSAANPLLKALQKPKGIKSKMSGWSRLKKHMVVEQDEPAFPGTGSQQEATEQDQSAVKREDGKVGDNVGTQDEKPAKDTPKATKMWDAVLFQMFSTKENIMHQIELNKNPEEKEKEKEKEIELKDVPSFAHRLPVLLFSPKFDAKKLKEAASKPMTKISTVFEMGLIGRKGKEEEPKDFNRTARGFAAT